MNDEAHGSDWTAFHTSETHRRDWAPGYERPESLARKPLLDQPSEPHPILSLLMDEALMRIMLVSDGAVMALKVRVTGSRRESTPSSDLAVVIDSLGERYGKCKTHRKRLVVIKEAQDTADRLRHAPNRAMVRGTNEWGEAISRDPRSCRVLASVYGVDFSTISRIKKKFRSVA